MMKLGGWKDVGDVYEALTLPGCGCEPGWQVGLGTLAEVGANLDRKRADD